MSLILLFQGGGDLPAPTEPDVFAYPGVGVLAVQRLAGEHATIGDFPGDVASIRRLAGERVTSREVVDADAESPPLGGKVTIH